MSSEALSVVIVGAGPGGLAVAGALLEVGLSRQDLLVLDKGEVGQAWLDYPSDTRLLSESKQSKDDNQIAGVSTSEVFPNIPHPNHIMYQKYLDYVAQKLDIPVRRNTTVEKVVFDHDHKEFVLRLRDETNLRARFVVWAGGMYATPNEDMNMEGCFIHYAKMPYLEDVEADEVTVVGSSNGASGVVMMLAKPGRVVRLVVSREYTIPEPIDCLWKENMQFVKELENQGLVTIVEHFRVKRIYKDGDKYFLESEDGQKLTAADRPIICTGFHPNIEPIKDLVTEFCEDRETRIEMDEAHQSKKQAGLYLAGVIGRLENDNGFIVSFREFGKPIAQSIISQLR